MEVVGLDRRRDVYLGVIDLADVCTRVAFWVGCSTNTTIVTGASYSSIDVDGDGLADLAELTIAADGTGTLAVQLNTGAGAGISFAAPVITNTGLPKKGSIIGNNQENGQIARSPVKKFDFDGDGRGDLIYISAVPGSAQVGELVSRGLAPFVFTTGVTRNGTILPVNWNDDSCTDLIVSTFLIISPCNGSSVSIVDLPVSMQLGIDWDGDGRTDALVNVGGVWQLYRSEGTTYAPPVSTGVPALGGIVSDRNGDGLAGLIYASGSGLSLSYASHNGAGVRADLATSFTDGYGLAAKPSYVSIAQSTSGYTSYLDSTFPYQDFFGPLEVVSSVVYTDPSNAATGTYSQSLLYSAMWKNLQGRGLTPFQAVQTTDSRNNYSLYTNYSRSFPYTGMQEGFYFANPDSSPVSQGSVLTWNTTPLDSTPNNQRYFPYIMTTYRYDYELPPNQLTGYPNWITETDGSYAYDNSGNATNVTTTVIDDDPNSPYYTDTWTSTTVNSFTPNTSTWCLNLPTETTVTNSSTAPNGSAITRTASYNSPDYTYCRQTEKVIEPNSSTYKVVEDYVYDTSYGNFGNLHSTTVTGVGMSPRVTTILWTSNGQFPQTITNPLSQSVQLTFDPTNGMKVVQLDPNSTLINFLATSWTYDNFARELRENHPDGTATTTSYNDCATNGCVNANNKMTVTKTALNVGGSTQSVQNIYMDELDRPLVTSSLMLNGAYDRNEVQYDSLGNVHLQGAPCTFVSCATYWTTNTYDVLHRLTESQRPISATNSTLQSTTIGYAGRTTTITDALTHKTTKINLATGNLARSQDAAGYYQNFSYDAFGSLARGGPLRSPS